MGCKRQPLSAIADINAEQYSSKEKWPHIQYLDTGNVTHGRISALQQLVPGIDKVPGRARRKVKDGSIVYSMVRPNQKHYALLESPPTDMLVSTGFAVIDAKRNIVLPQYLYYALIRPEITAYFQALAEQAVSTYPTLAKDDLAQFEIKVPSLDEQRAVSSLLASLDRKIEVNHCINDYLTELCAARYDRARREASRGTEGVLTDLIEVNYGRNHKRLEDGPYPVYGSGGLMRHVEKYLYEGESVLIPRKGSLNNVMLVDGCFWTVDTMFFTKELKVGAARYAYFMLKKLNLASLNVGSAVPSMTTKILSALPIAVPIDRLLEELKEWSDPLFRQIRQNESESMRLAEIRDSLLSRIMTGEIDVSKIELPTQPNNHLYVD